MFECDRPALDGSAGLDPDKELHAGCVRRIAHRLHRSVMPVGIGAPIASHDAPIAFKDRVGRNCAGPVPTGVKPIDIQGNIVLSNLLDDLQMLPRRNPTPDDSGNGWFNGLAIDLRCEVF